MNLRRRDFVRQTATVALVPGSVSALLAACSPDRRPTPAGGDYGPLLEPSDGGPLALPAGFSVRDLGRVGTPMSDGNLTPIAHDGMAAFPATGDGAIRLVRNHEDRNRPGFGSPIGGGARAYDPLAGGGTTTLVLDRDGNLVRDFVSIEGTFVNCAGGPTPRGSWLTCEETTAGPLEGFGQPHGYVFEVPSEADGPVDPVPLRAMGRFKHEAIAWDPETDFVYLTEDHDGLPEGPGSGFYRFRPTNPTDLAAGGALECLRVVGRDRHPLYAEGEVLRSFDVAWVPIDDPDPADADSVPISERNGLVFRQGLARGAAVFARLEGAWYGDGYVFFHDTDGGPAGKGHVWQYDPARERLTLIFVSPGIEVLDSPDNITVSPQGNIVICEDGSDTQYLRGLTRAGHIFDLARNTLNKTEFAGATFSPDGRLLFVNIQGSTSGTVADAVPGVTLVISGPWEEGPL